MDEINKLDKIREIEDGPRAAVLRVPKGRLRSDIGSQTSISPSKMILF